ncbi:MAG: hypothetical protein ACPG45_02975 [Flavobacteriaceae bacterium]
MKNIIYATLVFLFFSCATKHERPTYRFDSKTSEHGWVVAYKQHVFYSCLKEGYQNDSIFILMRKEDSFNAYQLGFPMIDRARLLGKKIAKDIKVPFYIAPVDPQLRNISFTCLCFYDSRELDSIARAEYYYDFKKKYDRKTW